MLTGKIALWILSAASLFLGLTTTILSMLHLTDFSVTEGLLVSLSFLLLGIGFQLGVLSIEVGKQNSR